jgi:hypothetical protein
MATLGRQPSTADHQTWASVRAAIDAAFSARPRYSDGTVLVPADIPDLATAIELHAEVGAPVVVVHADGHEEYVVGSKSRDRLALGLALGALGAFAAATLRRVRV